MAWSWFGLADPLRGTAARLSSVLTIAQRSAHLFMFDLIDPSPKLADLRVFVALEKVQLSPMLHNTPLNPRLFLLPSQPLAQLE